MARMVGQDPALTGPILEVAAQILDFKAKAIKAVLISNPVKALNSNSPAIRVIQSS